MQSHLSCVILTSIYYSCSILNLTISQSILLCVHFYLLLQQLCFKIPLAQWGAYKSSAPQNSLVSLSILLLFSSPVLNTSALWITKHFLYLSLSWWQQNQTEKRNKKASLSNDLSFIFHRTFTKLVYLLFVLQRTQVLVYFPFKQPSDEPQLQNTQHCQNTLEGLELHTELKHAQCRNGGGNRRKFPLGNGNLCNTL